MATVVVADDDRAIRKIVTDRLSAAGHVVEAAPDGMLVVDTEGRILLTNPQLDRLFGYPEGELIGQRMEILVPPGSRPSHPGMRAGFVAQGRRRQMGSAEADLQGQRKDGGRFSIEIGLSFLPEI